MNWHYVENGQQTGPVDETQFQALVRDGKINDRTLVWHEGMAEWIPYAQTTTLAADNLAAPLGESSEAACTECGKIFPKDEMIRHGSAFVCANCKPVFMQKLSEGAEIKMGDMNYARILTRFAALVLDIIILGAVNFVIGLIAGLNLAQAAGVQRKGAVELQLILVAIQLAIGISYEVILIGKYGATLGKMACKIKVVTADGGRVSYARAFGRYFAKILSGMICLIGYIIAIFDKPQRRALHDHICNTRVINK